MHELPKQARALLDAARAAHDPSRPEREQADYAVRAALAAYGVHMPPLPPPSAPSFDTMLSTTNAAGAAGAAGSSAAAATKVGTGVLVLCACAWLVLQAYQRESAEPARTVPAAVLATPAVPAQTIELAAVLPPATEALKLRSRSTLAAEPAHRRPRALERRDHAPQAGVDAEVLLIAEADAMLRAERFDDALGTLAQHARRFPNGVLREERAALRVLSLCGSEPDARARRERERFLRTAPGSVLSARVGAACAELGAPSP